MKIIDGDALLKNMVAFCEGQRHLVPEEIWTMVENAPELSLALNSPRTVLERELVPLIKPGEYFYISDGSLVQADEEGGHYSNTAKAWIVNDTYGNGYLEDEVDEIIPGKKTAFTWEQLCNRAFGVPEDRPKEFAAKDNAYEHMRQVILKEDGYDINDKPEGEFDIDRFLRIEEHVRNVQYFFDEDGNFISSRAKAPDAKVTKADVLHIDDSVWCVHSDGHNHYYIIEYQIINRTEPIKPYNPAEIRYEARPLVFDYENIQFYQKEINANVYTSFEHADNARQELEKGISTQKSLDKENGHICGKAKTLDGRTDEHTELELEDSVWLIHDDDGYSAVEYKIRGIIIDEEESTYHAYPVKEVQRADIKFVSGDINANVYTSWKRAQSVLYDLTTQELEEDAERE